MEKLKVFEAFSGIGSQRMALRNLGMPHEVVAIAEIDKYAIQSYMAIHGETLNLGDISKIKVEDIPDHHLFCLSFPCQDLSVSGNLGGLAEGSGTRSSLLWECKKVIEGKKPKYLLLENVKNLVSKRFKPDFEKWLEWLESQGYTNYWQVLNAKDYGLPQNRERVFVVSILDDNQGYEFPEPIELKLKLKDLLEDEVDEKFYLSDSALDYMSRDRNGKPRWEYHKNNYEGNACTVTANIHKGVPTIEYKGEEVELPCIARSVGRNPENTSDRTPGVPTEQFLELNTKGTSNTITTVQKDNYVLENKTLSLLSIEDGELRVRVANKKGYDVAVEGDSINLVHPSSKTRRGRVGKQVAQTIDTGSGQVTVLSDYRIRRLIPLETWRLMGFSDEDFWLAKNLGVSDTQLYRQSGNAICVPVLEGIFSKLFL